jgi:hypothetical protein
MKNILFIAISLTLITFALTGCSKKLSGKMIGVWKSDSAAVSTPGFQVDVFYEFTKDSILAYGNVHGNQLDRIALTYKIKKEDKDSLILEAVQPQTNKAGDMKITFENEKMILVDPANMTFRFTRQ